MKATHVSVGLASIVLGTWSGFAGEIAVENPAPAFPIYGTVSAGYDLFRGGLYGDNAPWAGIDLNYDVSDKLSLNFGTWYTNPTNDLALVSDELDLYAFAVMPLECPLTGAWELAVGGTWFYFAEDSADEGELNLLLSKSIGDLFDLTVDYAYDLTYAGHYIGFYADKTVPLTDCLDLNLGTGMGHGDGNYNFLVGAGDHVYVRGGLTWHLTDRADLSGYVLGNFPYGDLEDNGQESDVYGGASLSVSF
ncbi:MAG: hypothetical protein ABL994_14315 [Verrucomicrobiales bacterium]